MREMTGCFQILKVFCKQNLITSHSLPHRTTWSNRIPTHILSLGLLLISCVEKPISCVQTTCKTATNEKITLHENYIHTFRSLYYFLIKENPIDFIILPLLAQNTVPSARHKKSVSWSDHSNVNKPQQTFHFSHVFVLRTRSAAFIRVVFSQLYNFTIESKNLWNRFLNVKQWCCNYTLKS